MSDTRHHLRPGSGLCCRGPHARRRRHAGALAPGTDDDPDRPERRRKIDAAETPDGRGSNRAAAISPIDGRGLAGDPGWRLACLRSVMAQHARLAFPFSVYEVAHLGVDGIGRALPRQRREALVAECLRRPACSISPDGATRPCRAASSSASSSRACSASSRPAAASPAAGALPGRADREPRSLPPARACSTWPAASPRAASRSSIVLHDLNLAVTYADHLVVMDQGRIIAQGPPAATLDDALLRQVFKVDLSLSRAPGAGPALPAAAAAPRR
jgi:iron complex transport system ATP-binding protein